MYLKTDKQTDNAPGIDNNLICMISYFSVIIHVQHDRASRQSNICVSHSRYTQESNQSLTNISKFCTHKLSHVLYLNTCICLANTFLFAKHWRSRKRIKTHSTQTTIDDVVWYWIDCPDVFQPVFTPIRNFQLSKLTLPIYTESATELRKCKITSSSLTVTRYSCS